MPAGGALAFCAIRSVRKLSPTYTQPATRRTRSMHTVPCAEPTRDCVRRERRVITMSSRSLLWALVCCVAVFVLSLLWPWVLQELQWVLRRESGNGVALAKQTMGSRKHCRRVKASAMGVAGLPLLWPQPLTAEFGGASAGLGPCMSLKLQGFDDAAEELISGAFDRLCVQIGGAVDEVSPAGSKTSPQLGTTDEQRIEHRSSELVVDLLNSNELESYNLSTTSTSGGLRVAVEAGGVPGALYAMQTFSQLAEGWLTRVPAKVSDRPRFPWRGLMIDSARHFIPVDEILRTLEATSLRHITDAQSFPLSLGGELDELAELGAFAAGRYSRADVLRIIDFARARAVIIVPEVDMPAHTASWRPAFPEVVLACKPEPGIGKLKALDRYMLDPTREKTWEIISGLFAALSSLFTMEPDVHLGMDEMSTSCWEADEGVVRRMHELGIENVSALQQYFTDRLIEIANAHGKKAIVWQDVWDAGMSLPKNVIIEPWKCTSDGRLALEKLSNAGVSVVRSYCWYLDSKDSWQTMYSHDPITPNSDASFVLGGESAMWTEGTDWTNLHCRVWPRAAAVAERLWSWPESTNSFNSSFARARLQRHVQRLRALGIASADAAAGTSEESSFCLAIPESVQRADRGAGRTQTRRLLLHNANGHRASLVRWLREQDVDVVALVELNDWEAPPGMSIRAAECGFPYSILFRVPSGFNLGLLSVDPIEVIAQQHEGFQKGALLVRTGGVLYALAHLDAQSDVAHLAEIDKLIELIDSSMENKAEPLLVLGDLNSLSPLESKAQVALQDALRSDPRLQSLKSKFLSDSSAGRFDYRALKRLLGSGLRDLCFVGGSDSCMPTEPTKLRSDQVPNGVELPPMRLLHLLGNRALLEAFDHGVAAWTVRDEETEVLSDHFPLRLHLGMPHNFHNFHR